MPLRATRGFLFTALLAGLACACASPTRVVPRMTSETIELNEKSNGDFHVRVTYYFSGRLRGFDKLSFPETDWYRLRNFRMVFNGRELAVTRREAGEGRLFYFNGRSFTALHTAIVGRVRGHEHVMINEYDFSPPAYDAKGDDPRFSYIEYILRTGSGWSGRIGKVEAFVRFARPICDRVSHLPGSYRGRCVNAGTWQLDLTDTAPHRDIQLLVPRK